jgi:hypothetical protein
VGAQTQLLQQLGAGLQVWRLVLALLLSALRQQRQRLPA